MGYHNENNKSYKELTAAEIKITVDEQKLHEWVVRYIAQDSDATPESESQSENQRPVLVAIDLQNRRVLTEIRTEPTVSVLTEICRRIFELGVQSDSADECATVEGSVQ